ncbi:hypothetical protein QTP88_018202 [Uroleucon formosanum]
MAETRTLCKSWTQPAKTLPDKHDVINMKTNNPVQSDFNEVKATVAVSRWLGIRHCLKRSRKLRKFNKVSPSKFTDGEGSSTLYSGRRVRLASTVTVERHFIEFSYLRRSFQPVTCSGGNWQSSQVFSYKRHVKSFSDEGPTQPYRLQTASFLTTCTVSPSIRHHQQQSYCHPLTASGALISSKAD